VVYKTKFIAKGTFKSTMYYIDISNENKSILS